MRVWRLPFLASVGGTGLLAQLFLWADTDGWHTQCNERSGNMYALTITAVNQGILK